MHATPSAKFAIDGNVASGLGRGAQFLAIDWVRRELREKLDLDAFPGTLNLRICEQAWSALYARRGEFVKLSDSSSTACPGFVQRVELRARRRACSAYLILPELTMYKDILEIIAAENLRERLGLKDGDAVHVEER